MFASNLKGIDCGSRYFNHVQKKENFKELIPFHTATRLLKAAAHKCSRIPFELVLHLANIAYPAAFRLSMLHTFRLKIYFSSPAVMGYQVFGYKYYENC